MMGGGSREYKVDLEKDRFFLYSGYMYRHCASSKFFSIYIAGKIAHSYQILPNII